MRMVVDNWVVRRMVFRIAVVNRVVVDNWVIGWRVVDR